MTSTPIPGFLHSASICSWPMVLYCISYSFRQQGKGARGRLQTRSVRRVWGTPVTHDHEHLRAPRWHTSGVARARLALLRERSSSPTLAGLPSSRSSEARARGARVGPSWTRGSRIVDSEIGHVDTEIGASWTLRSPSWTARSGSWT